MLRKEQLMLKQNRKSKFPPQRHLICCSARVDRLGNEIPGASDKLSRRAGKSPTKLKKKGSDEGDVKSPDTETKKGKKEGHQITFRDKAEKG